MVFKEDQWEHLYVFAKKLESDKVAFDEINEIRLNKKLVFNLGAKTPMSDQDDILFHADLFFQGGNKQIQGGLMYMHNFLTIDEEVDLGIGIGGFYRWNDAFIPAFKFNWYKLALGISYDVNVSQLRAASTFRGGVEVTLSYKTYLNIMNSSLQKVRCLIPL
jgi:hypothetical protein